ncbi:nitroreductase family protein [Mycolicibacterium chubuense NBB4]|uniref:Nitroreductase family protein n=1 Tax=Mycolicibacterium chubuense (strain NBB4) TaxID=710421 RepID=I4BRK7_MYCCN|nr:nitroreductase family protein [Mycolicibacterium chubuense]AFM19914.1 nitroreductase family protein [Mycolicibacterium chubuense NBB4]
MPNAFPDAATLRTVLDLASWAPSAQNAQPWHWLVDSDGLHLDADWDRRLGDTPADRSDVLLSCGAVLHHCAVALAAAGWHPRIRRFPDGGAGRLASFELIESSPVAASVELASAIPRRRSDRREYGESALAPATLELLLIRAARLGVQMSVVPKDRWVRLGEGRIELSYGPVGDDQPPPSGPGDGVLLVLATEADDDRSRLRAGEATSDLLLSATALDLASCPLTEPLRDARARLALACDVFDGEAHPQVLVRVGPAIVGAPELPPGPRRPVAATTTWT